MSTVRHCFSCKTEDRPLRRMTVEYDALSWSLPVCDECLKQMTGIEFLSLQVEEQR